MLPNAWTGCSSSHCYGTSIHRKTAGTPVYLPVWNTEKLTTFKTLPDTETQNLKQIYWQMYSLDVYSTGHLKCQSAVQLVWKDWEDSYEFILINIHLSVTEHRCLNKLLSSIIFDVLLKFGLITFFFTFSSSAYSQTLFPKVFHYILSNEATLQTIYFCSKSELAQIPTKKLHFTCSLCGSWPNRFSDLERAMSDRKAVHARVAPVHKADNRCILSSDNFKSSFSGRI